MQSALISVNAAETPCHRSIEACEALGPGPELICWYSSSWLYPFQRCPSGMNVPLACAGRSAAALLLHQPGVVFFDGLVLPLDQGERSSMADLSCRW